MKLKITFSYWKDPDEAKPSVAYDKFQMIAKFIQMVEQIDKEPYWSIERDPEPPADWNNVTGDNNHVRNN